MKLYGLLNHAVLLLALILGKEAVARTPEPLEAIGPNLNEEVLTVPVHSSESVDLQVTLFKPPGPGPFPILLINHGKSEGNPKLQPRARYYTVAREFVRRGYMVVLPMRKGFSGSGGTYVSAGCNMYANAQLQAADVAAIAQWARQQPQADAKQILVFGQSYGGLATLALIGNRQLPIKLAVNFAGGLKVNSSTKPCDWKSSLVEAVGRLGALSKVPSLWFYGENDSYFDPELSQQMFEAFRQQGGSGELLIYPGFKQDAHKMFGDPEGWPIWLPKTLSAMKKVGLPTEVKYVTGSKASPPPSGYAPLDEATRLPFIQDSGKVAYKSFLNRVPPRAFALSQSGAWGWAAGGDEAISEAIKNCQKYSQSPCKLYAVDEEVVWQNAGDSQ